MKRTYREIKAELEEVMEWFEGDSVEIDEAIERHAQAEKLLAELEAYLKSAEGKFKESSK